MQTKLKMQQGFTLVELSLAIAIIGVLSIIVFLIISNAVSAYHRGLTLNQLNSVGMNLVDDMRTAVQSSPGRFNAEAECGAVYDSSNNSALDTCLSDGALSFTYIERRATVTTPDNDLKNVPVYGAFCTGAYSYIWNSGYYFAEGYGSNTPRAEFRANLVDGGSVSESDFKILKVEDDSKAVCKAGAGVLDGEYRAEMNNDNFNLTCSNLSENNKPADVCKSIDRNTIETDLLLKDNNNDTGLALYDLTSARPATSPGTNNMFYAVSFILGTVQGGIDVLASGNYCAPPEGYNNSAENFDYCAINKFNFAAQATGG